MIHSIAKFVEIIATIGVISGMAYNLLCLWSATVFLRDRKAAGEGARPTQSAPPVSILKPLKGADPEMYECFRSHCLQDYPEYEIIFGVSDPNDSAIEAVKRLMTEFPRCQIRLLICQQELGTNIKVSSLAQMLREAKHEFLVVNDSDIRVGPSYLRNVVAPLLDPTIGLVTCLYRGVPASTLGSQLESIAISTDFSPGVLAARTIENGIRFGLGSTLAFRRATLDAIGGFESFVDYLADDYELGKRISEIGLQVVLSEEIVETYLPRYSFAEFMRHQLRWARSVRESRFWGSVGLIFTFVLPWGALALISSSGAVWAWGLLALAFCVRAAIAVIVGRDVLKDKTILRRAWLIPLRDLLAVFIWMGSFTGNTVEWRGDRFDLKGGKLVRKL